MGDRIKTAWEKAMERLEEKDNTVTSENVLEMECRPEGQKLAGRFIQEPEFELHGALEEYTGEKKEAVRKNIEETLLSRLVLPENEAMMQENRRVMEGLLQVKQNKNSLRPLLEELEFVFNQYMQARSQSYESLKQDFQSRVNEAMQKMEGQLNSQVSIDPEKHPRFREEWMKLVGKVNEKFLPLLESARDQIRETL